MTEPVAATSLDLRTLHKAEVHVHLEGCLERDDLVARAHRLGEPLPRPAERLFAVGSFDEFLDLLSWSCGLLRTTDEVAEIAYAYAKRVAADHVVRADLIVNPTHWHTWRGNLRGLIEALDHGLADAEADGLATVGVCVSILRQQSAAEAAQLVDELIELAHPRVVGLSIDGNEALAGRTGPRFADAFDAARRAGLRRTVHAGETSGAEGVWDAVQLLHADRIDHGVAAVHDPALVELLAERGIPLGICPTSNLTLGICATLAEHPIEVLRRAGVRVSVNTDDPGFLGIDLTGEYTRCAQAFGWDDVVVGEVAQTALDACFTGAGS